MFIKILILSFLFISQQALALTDDLQLKIDESMGGQLRWDNLEGAEEWLDGEKPSENNGIYKVNLKSNKNICILVNENTWLRLFSEGNVNWLDDLKVTQSIDGLLYVDKILNKSNLDKNYMLKPVKNTTSVCIKNISDQAIFLALYVSREFLSSFKLHYKESIPIDLDKINLLIMPNIGWQSHYVLPNQHEINITIDGPKRLKIILRQPMSILYKPVNRSYLNVSMDGINIEVFDLYFKEDVRHNVRISGKRQTMSAAEIYYINVPKGKHQLTLEASTRIYFQLFGLGEQVWSNHNIPNSIGWLNKKDEVSVNKIQKMREVFLKKAEDNSVPESALSSLQSLEKVTDTSYAMQNSLDDIEKVIKYHRTRFEAILPKIGGKYQQRWFRYLTSSLQYSLHGPVYYLSEHFIKYRLNEINEQVFYKLSQKGLTFLLNKLPYDSDIKFLIYAEDKDRKSDLKIKFDNGKYNDMHISARNIAVDFERESVNQHIVKKQSCCKLARTSVVNFTPAMPLINVASYIVQVKSHVKKIELIPIKNKTTLWVSIQQRVTSQYQLSEQQYRYQLNKLDNPSNYFLSLLTDYRENNISDGSELSNHWQPLFKKIYARYLTNIENINAIEYSEEPKGMPYEVDKLESELRQLINSKKWVLVVEYCSKLLPLVNGYTYQRILSNLVLALQKSSQYGLTKQLQRSIIFSDMPFDFVYQNLNNLLDQYKKQENSNARISLASAFFMYKPNIENLQILSKILFEEARWKSALQLELLLPLNKQNLNRVLYAALQSHWFFVFDNKLTAAMIADDDKDRWLGIKSLIMKDYDKAGVIFNKYPSINHQYLSRINDSKKIKSNLYSINKSNSNKIFNKWTDLQKNILNKNSIWKESDNLVMKSSGQVNLYNQKTNIFQTHNLVDADKSVEFEVVGPIDLRLQLRPLHLNDEIDSEINSHYYIIESDNQKKVLINKNRPSKNWKINSPSKYKAMFVGGLVNTHVIVPAGIHKITIQSDMPLLLRLQTKQLKEPVSVLPLLNSYLMKNILFFNEELNTQVLPIKINESLDYTRLSNIAFQLSNDTKNSIALMAEAEKLYNVSSNKFELISLMQRIRTNSQWILLSSIEKSNGFWLQKFSRERSESPQSRIYQAIFLNANDAHYILRNETDLILSLYNPHDTQIELQLKSLSPFFIRPQSLNFRYQLDQNEASNIQVLQELTTIKLNIPKGRHSIKLSLLGAPLYHRLWLSFSEQDKRIMELDKSRRYQIATQQQPLVYSVEGPLWLRIDKRLGDVVTSDYRYITKSQKKLVLSADSIDYDTFYRVFYRGIKPVTRKKNQLDIISSTPKVPIKVHDVKAITNNENTKLVDAWMLGKQEDATITYQVSQITKNIVSGELGNLGDEFTQFDIAYRHYNKLSEKWFYLSALTRYRQQGSATFGVKSRLRGYFDFIPIDWTIESSFYTQQLYTGQEWSAQIKLSLSQFRTLNQYFYHLPKVQILRRTLSADTNNLNVNVDQDVSSAYKYDHPSSIRVSETLIYRPYQDMEFYLGAERISNPHWITLDQFRSRVGWRLIWGNMRWDINARRIQFKADEDRSFDSSRGVLQTRLLLEKWVKSHYRLELSASFERDIDTHQKTLGVTLSLHQSEGRGYLDYSPAELLFKNIRQAKLLPELNNELN